jgi:hypothetical protein
MKQIINYINRFMVKEAPKPLGRWNKEYCNLKLDKKIDMSNEDHCGPCGQYAKDVRNLEIKKDKK